MLAMRLNRLLAGAKVPKGFEKFYKPSSGSSKGASKPSGSTSKKPDAKGKKEPLSSKKINLGGGASRLGGGGGTSGGPGGDPNFTDGGMRQLATLVGMTALAAMVLPSSSSSSGREITYSDFLRTLLPSGEVERIVVMNKNQAKVIMKRGAEGVFKDGGQGNWNTLSTSDTSFPSSPPSGNSPIDQQAAENLKTGADAWGDSTTMDLRASANGGISENGVGGNGKDAIARQITTQMNNGGQGQISFYFNIGSVESFERKLESSQVQLGIPPSRHIPVQYVSETSWGSELMKIAPTVLLIGAYLLITRSMAGGGGGGGMGNVFKIGKSNAKKIKKEDVNVTFKDVAGCQEAKKEIMEFVDFLEDSSRFAKLGAKIPKGALLCGPPGTGKTLLAKAVAGEAAVPFFSISGSDFIEMFVGVGPSRVRDLFKEARANAPCIVFIDEIDAVGRQRGKGGFSGGNDERENTLNQLLVEMDGFSESSGVVVLAGTNRVDILDQALTRPGRFDRQITVDKPDIQGRKEIFMVHLRDIKTKGDPEEYAGRLAGLTPGMAGADIANMCNEAAIVAARRKADFVEMSDFEEATDRVIGGLESNKLISDKEKEIVAHHEAGHAVAGWFLEHADPLMKVTIVPRSSGALGFAQYLPKEIYLRSREEITDIVCMALAGRAAEQIIFGRVTTGASDDLRRVTGMVYQMIQVYGMDESIGQLSFPKDESNPYAGKPYSDKTAEAMDQKAKEMVDEAYERTLDLLMTRKEELVKVAELLMQKETINHDDVVDLIGPRPFVPDKQYEDYISGKQHRAEGEVEEEQEEEVVEKDEEEEEVIKGPLGLASKGEKSWR
mmetsp:Transcript_17965/g.37372  ORF Transcript_17965/g.37372 Transcript_17965/m.37372 type:complete len:837 (+) Transcript_17965:22-2532(+)